MTLTSNISIFWKRLELRFFLSVQYHSPLHSDAPRPKSLFYFSRKVQKTSFLAQNPPISQLWACVEAREKFFELSGYFDICSLYAQLLKSSEWRKSLGAPRPRSRKYISPPISIMLSTPIKFETKPQNPLDFFSVVPNSFTLDRKMGEIFIVR